MTHTPGPWIFEPGDKGDDSVGLGAEPPTIIAEVGNGATVEICELREPGYPMVGYNPEPYDDGVVHVGTVGANGALIEVAPDMLSALDGFLTLCRHMNALQHAGFKVTPDLWSALYDLQCKAGALTDRVHAAEREGV